MGVSSPWCRTIATRLAALGARIHIVDFTLPGTTEYITAEEAGKALAELESAAADVHQMDISHAVAGLAPAALKLRGIVRRAEADIVLTLSGGLSALIAFASGTRPYVTYVVGSDVLLARGLRRRVSGLTLRKAALVLANGKHLADSARELSPATRVENLYIGVETDRFTQPMRPLQPRFVCTRVFRPVYDNFNIIRALSYIRSVPTNFEMSFISAGFQWEEAKRLARETLAPERARQVRFHGWVSDEALASSLKDSSFYVSSSLSDGTSSSLLEAMTSGLIPILSDIPANREWIRHGENGFLFPAGDPVALARCMESAMEGQPWMSAARESNRRTVATHGDAETNVGLLYERLQQVVATTGSAI
jgi:L-malate glycosyltransferase